jgi:hypothetical protein
MVFEWRENYRPSVPAQAAGERLAHLRSQAGGYITAQSVVDDARPPDSVLHPCFTWDDARAAELHREEEARRLIRNCYVAPEEGQPPVLHNIHVILPDVGPCYVTTARVVSERDLYEQAERDAIAALKGLRARYEHIQSLAAIFAAIDRLDEPAEAEPVPETKGKARGKRKPAA